MSRNTNCLSDIRSEGRAVVRMGHIQCLLMFWCARNRQDALSLCLVLDIVIARDYIVFYASAVLSRLFRWSVCCCVWTFCDVFSRHPVSRVNDSAPGLYGDILVGAYLHYNYQHRHIIRLYLLDHNQCLSYDRLSYDAAAQRNLVCIYITW